MTANKQEILAAFSEGLKKFDLDSSAVSARIEDDGILTLEGSTKTWQTAVDIGHMAAKLPGVHNVVSDLTAPGAVPLKRKDSAPYRAMGVVDKADAVIIGGGVTGCAIARQLTQYRVNILLLEKEEDLCEGSSKANNGMVHSGYDSKPASLKARLNVRGNAQYTKWAQQLGFQFNRTGSFVCGFGEEDRAAIESLYDNGVTNGVPGIEIISGDRARELEPGLSDGVQFALWTPSAGYAEPYEVTLALAENAVDNGARFRLGCEAVDILTEDGRVQGVVTTQGVILCDCVINAAGLYADEIAEMAGDRFYSIHPRRGALVIFDKENKGKIHTFSGVAPNNYTKGGGPEETPEGTLLWGPSALEVPDKEDRDVDREDVEFILEKGMHLTKGIDPRSVITYFSGNRAATYSEDFVIQNSRKIKGFIHVAGIQSPGFASAPAIAELVESLYLGQNPNAPINTAFNPIRKPEPAFRDCTQEERDRLIAENPAYGRVICRCETVTEAEILRAVHAKIPARTMDAVKRRTRAGMGRCQSGFCGSRVLELLAREWKLDPSEVTLKGKGSEILVRPSRNTGRNAE
ncbi:MAG: NAD(P)/FAD-dependent oxidoreductase [bacterium]